VGVRRGVDAQIDEGVGKQLGVGAGMAHAVLAGLDVAQRSFDRPAQPGDDERVRIRLFTVVGRAQDHRLDELVERALLSEIPGG
jgi:hypothetical protein